MTTLVKSIQRGQESINFLVLSQRLLAPPAANLRTSIFLNYLCQGMYKLQYEMLRSMIELAEDSPLSLRMALSAQDLRISQEQRPPMYLACSYIKRKYLIVPENNSGMQIIVALVRLTQAPLTLSAYHLP
uniref:Uncharacterized protein n=1 Tax=Opuntia streptacantha TaxID=393608 RepID=A0A7C9AK28_OPUST